MFMDLIAIRATNINQQYQYHRSRGLPFLWRIQRFNQRAPTTLHIIQRYHYLLIIQQYHPSCLIEMRNQNHQFPHLQIIPIIPRPQRTKVSTNHWRQGMNHISRPKLQILYRISQVMYLECWLGHRQTHLKNQRSVKQQVRIPHTIQQIAQYCTKLKNLHWNRVMK